MLMQKLLRRISPYLLKR